MSIKSERYGGGHRWHCTTCNERLAASIVWTNSKPPLYCRICAGVCRSDQEIAAAAFVWLKPKISKDDSMRTIANLCDHYQLMPVGMSKTSFAKLICEVMNEP